MRFRHFVALLAAAMSTATPARAEWHEVTSEHFIIQSESSVTHLTRLSQKLEGVHWMLSQLAGVTPNNAAQRVRIAMVDDIGDVHRAMLGSDSSAAGFYRPEVEGAIAVVPRSEGAFSTTILFHEYAHHFMLQYMTRIYPPWMVEGFAEFISTATIDDYGVISIGRPAQHRAYSMAAFGLTDSEQFFARGYNGGDSAGDTFYGQAWLTTHYFIMDAQRRRRLNQFLRAWAEDGDYNAAVAQLVGDFDQFDTAIGRYRRECCQYTRITLPVGISAAPVIRAMRPAEGAIVELSIRDRDNMDDADRARYLRQLGEVQANYPDDSAVNLLVAQSYYSFKNWATAIAAADRVLAIEPTNRRAAIYRAWAAIQARSEQDGEISAAEALALRRPIIDANRADPNDPTALLAFAESFTLLRQSMNESAVRAYVRAAQLTPQLLGLRMSAAHALLANSTIDQVERLAAARAMLVPVAYNPHQNARQNYALQLLQWVEQGAAGAPPIYVEPPHMTVPDGSDR